MQSCGCKICKANLGEHTNHWVQEGWQANKVLDELKSMGVAASGTLLRKHLSAFGIDYPEPEKPDESYCVPVTVDLNDIDFSEYNFDANNAGSIVGYLQKINLKIYLNQSKITIQAQQEVIDGNAPNVPKEVLQNMAICFQILERSGDTLFRQQQMQKMNEARINQMTGTKLPLEDVEEIIGSILQSAQELMTEDNYQTYVQQIQLKLKQTEGASSK